MPDKHSPQVNDAGSPVSLVEPLPPASQLSQPPLIASRPKETILNDAGWSTPQSEKNQPGKYTYIMQFAGDIWPSDCGSYGPSWIGTGVENGRYGTTAYRIVARRKRIRGERVDIHEKINPAFPSQAWRLKREIAGLMNLIRVAVPVNFRVNFRYY